MKQIYARVVGLFLLVSGSFHFIQFWLPSNNTPGQVADKKLINIGAALFSTGNYSLLAEFKRTDKWQWRSERNGMIFLAIILIALLLVYMLSN